MNASTLSEVFSYRQKTCDLFDTAGLAKALHEDGFALIPGVLSPSEVVQTKEALDRLQPFGLDGSRWSELNKHFKCVFNRDRLWLSYADRPGIIELAEALMGSDCHIIGMTAWKSEPGYDQEFQRWYPPRDLSVESIQNRKLVRSRSRSI